jgi:AraC-like DNA-binding protein
MPEIASPNSNTTRDGTLTEVRRALSSGRELSVTEVANRFGFRELARFAGQYREAFGENLSDTWRARLLDGRPDHTMTRAGSNVCRRRGI